MRDESEILFSLLSHHSLSVVIQLSNDEDRNIIAQVQLDN